MVNLTESVGMSPEGEGVNVPAVLYLACGLEISGGVRGSQATGTQQQHTSCLHTFTHVGPLYPAAAHQLSAHIYTCRPSVPSTSTPAVCTHLHM